ncbi:MAG TPA: 2-dehydropantoate 2-reductase [Candidatus Bathyarchaeia archaeon]|nr:2-dehydropantoate 2-reductase [Candidatus Bathyarchaeia archaeon]
MRIAIIGPGALGCLFGIRLNKTGHDIILVHHRKRSVRRIKASGVRLKNLSGRIEKANLKIQGTLHRSDRVDLVIVTVKAYDTETVARSLKGSLGPLGLVLTLQNGLNNLETLSRYIPAKAIVGGSTTEGAYLIGEGYAQHTGRGTTWLGQIVPAKSANIYHLKKVFQGAGFSTRVTRNVKGVLWSKAIVNSAINPLTALTRLRNGELVKVPGLLAITIKVVEEGQQVCSLLGIKTTRPGPGQLLEKILSSTALNKSSMLQDVEKGKRSEILQLNGMIAKFGKSRNLDTPYNTLLTNLVLGLESSKTSR